MQAQVFMGDMVQMVKFYIYISIYKMGKWQNMNC